MNLLRMVLFLAALYGAFLAGLIFVLTVGAWREIRRQQRLWTDGEKPGAERARPRAERAPSRAYGT